MEESELTQKKLKELLHYNPLSGIFIWKERPLNMFYHCEKPENICNAWNSSFAGKKAGHKHNSNKNKTLYVGVTITLNKKRKEYKAHRLVFLYLEGHFPPEQVDHIDGNGLNNKIINLRKVNNQENSKNKPIQINNTSGHTGIGWHKPSKKWMVRVQINGKLKHCGLFSNIEDAIARRKQMEIEHGYHKNHGRKIKP